jgi:riboflavin synthase
VFTGLVQAAGSVIEARPAPTGAALVLEAATWSGALEPPLVLGESIAVNGCCLTLARLETPSRGARLEFDVIHQTLRLTTLSRLAVGGRANLERSATPTTLLGGHVVQGHVDAVARVVDVTAPAGERRVRVALPRELMRYVVERGSIAIDGVALTIAALDDSAATIDVYLIPETLQRTTLGDLAVGASVNVEVDCLAKLVERALAFRAS